MSNNPFRGKPSTSEQQKVEDWGKTKFNPTQFGDKGKKPFNRHQGDRGGSKPFNKKFDNRKGNNFHKKNDAHKFNQVARDAKPENATPWNKYKDEIIYKQREEEQAAQQANMDSSEGKSVLKQREINYRKSLIEKKKQEPTQWEDFGEAAETKKNENSNESTQNKQSKRKNKKQKNPENKLNEQSKSNFKKNVSNSMLKADVNEFISEELLDNFDSEKLNYKQNDKLRAVITRTTLLAKGGTLKNAVKNMKRQISKQEEINKKNKTSMN